MKKQEELQSLDEEQLQGVTGGMNDDLVDDLMEINHEEQRTQLEHTIQNFPPGVNPRTRAALIRHYTTIYPASERAPFLPPIPESPQREAADAQQWVTGGNANKRRRTH